MFGHGRLERRGLTGECRRCGYVGMLNPATGRLLWS
jgi:hypothetical protein